MSFGPQVHTRPGVRALAALSDVATTVGRASRDLAPAPPGSGLVPVPGDPGPPIVGYTFLSLRSPIEGPQLRYEQYGPVSWSRSFGRDIVSVFGGEGVEDVLANKDHAFSQRGWEYFIGPFFRRGLMLLDFEEHRYHRRVMQQAFTHERLKGYFARLGPAIRGGMSSWEDGSRVKLYPAIKELSLNLATEVFMDSRVDAGSDRINAAFVATVRAGTSFIRVPVPGGRWSAGLQGRRVLEEVFRERLPAKRQSDGDDLFSALCHAETDDGERFTDDDIVNHMIFLMMAAHDTTTITTSIVAYHLAKFPEWQERARSESLALGDDPLGIDDLGRLPTLDLVIKESLRLVPPVPGLARETASDTDLLGHFVPAGTLIVVSPWFNHFHTEYWSEPGRFDPGRFSDERREDQSHRYAWMPFGGGMHKCIGQHFGLLEVKGLLHELLRSKRLSVAPDYELTLDTIGLPVPSDGLPVMMEGL